MLFWQPAMLLSTCFMLLRVILVVNKMMMMMMMLLVDWLSLLSWTWTWSVVRRFLPSLEDLKYSFRLRLLMIQHWPWSCFYFLRMHKTICCPAWYLRLVFFLKFNFAFLVTILASLEASGDCGYCYLYVCCTIYVSSWCLIRQPYCLLSLNTSNLTCWNKKLNIDLNYFFKFSPTFFSCTNQYFIPFDYL